MIADAAVASLTAELEEQKAALETKMSALAAAETEREDLEARCKANEEEKEANEQRITTLKMELDLIRQDNQVRK